MSGWGTRSRPSAHVEMETEEVRGAVMLTARRALGAGALLASRVIDHDGVAMGILGVRHHLCRARPTASHWSAAHIRRAQGTNSAKYHLQ